MQAQFEKVIQKLDGLTSRERSIVLVAGTVMILLSWYMVFGEQAVKQHDRKHSELNTIATQVSDIEARIVQQTQLQNGQTDPNAKLADLKSRTTAVEGQIQDYAAELISPTEMARLLERVLERRSELRLRRLRNLGAEDLLPEDSPGQNRLYRHGLELELEGPYLAVLAYLRDLETLPWRLYWQVLEIDVDEYPINRILIEVATLSLHEDWIGV